MSVRLLLIRHARPDLDARDFRTTSRGRQWDPPLHPQGLEQARALAARLLLMDRPVSIAVSPFRRCRETLDPFLAAIHGRAVVDEDLGEVFIGAWEGVAFEQIISGDEELARRFREQEIMFGLAPGGESGAELRARVIPAVERIIEPLEDGVVVVLTHGGVINAYLGPILGIGHDMFFSARSRVDQHRPGRRVPPRGPIHQRRSPLHGPGGLRAAGGDRGSPANEGGAGTTRPLLGVQLRSIRRRENRCAARSRWPRRRTAARTR